MHNENVSKLGEKGGFTIVVSYFCDSRKKGGNGRDGIFFLRTIKICLRLVTVDRRRKCEINCGEKTVFYKY